MTALAGVVLAAGRGARLRPLTDLVPKALCPIDGRPLLDRALDRLEPHTGLGPADVAVNAHYLPDQVRAHVGDRAHISEEQPEALGTAGALGALRDWIDGRDVLVTNADAYLPGGLVELVEGWDGQRMRLLGKQTGSAADFGTVRYVGTALLPWRDVERLQPVPSGLYEVLWRDTPPDLVETEAVAIDCGRPGDYLAANLDASGGASVVGAGAIVDGRIERCVVWPGAMVRAGEHLVDAIRAGTPEYPVTVLAYP